MLSRVINQVVMWTLTIYYAVWVVCKIIKDCFTLRIREVFHKRNTTRPSCLDDPALGTHGILSLKGIKLHYVVSGPEDKPLMLMVHGFPEFWFSWRYQIKEFQKDYRVVAVDLRGCGDSEKPADVWEYSMKKLTSDLKQVITALGYKSCILLGHDLGAVISLAFSSYLPEMVDKLIVLNGIPLPLAPVVQQKQKEQRKMSWYVSFFQLPYLPELYLKVNNFEALESCFGFKKTSGLCFSDTSKLTKAQMDVYKFNFTQPGALRSAVNYYRCLLQQEADAHALSYPMPLLLIWGCNDRCAHRDCVQVFQEAVPKITVKLIEEAGHFVHMDAPDIVNEIIRNWL